MRRSMLATRGRAPAPCRLPPGMRSGRLRWATVGRAAAVLGLLGLAVAWPRLAPPPPALPGDDGVPVAPAGGQRPAEGERRAERGRPVEGKRSAEERRGARKRRAVRSRRVERRRRPERRRRARRGQRVKRRPAMGRPPLPPPNSARPEPAAVAPRPPAPPQATFRPT